MKKTLRQINKIININKHKDKILCIKTGNKLESDPYLIANTFSNYFTIVAKNLASKINTNQSFSKFLDKRQKNSIFLNLVTKNEIEICIKSLDSKKSPDIYGMSPKFLKDISETIS